MPRKGVVARIAEGLGVTKVAAPAAAIQKPGRLEEAFPDGNFALKINILPGPGSISTR
jgi:hypothetical protein